METISKLPLNAVFTSSVDPSIAKSFRINGREVGLVLSNQDNPAAPRNRQLLHLTCLFGRAGESHPSERPPSTSNELLQRKYQHAAPLIARLKETTTSLGVLLIDGLTCGLDWLDSDILSGILGTFAPSRVFWFGWDQDCFHKNKEFQQFVETVQDSVDFIQERLAVALKKLELSHKTHI